MKFLEVINNRGKPPCVENSENGTIMNLTDNQIRDMAEGAPPPKGVEWSEVLTRLARVAVAARLLRHKNKFDGTWVEANDWENMQDRLRDLTDG